MARRAGRPARLLAGLALLLCGAGLLAQAGFMLRDADRALSAEHRGALRSLLLRADRVIPAGAPYAATSAVRSDNARYYLYPRPRVATGFDRSSLERSGVRWVIVTSDAVPLSLRGDAGWYRVVAATGAGRLIEVTTR